MLKINCYAQTTVDLNGLVTRIGEDALPYIGDYGLFVADGLGGRGAIPIQDFFDGNNYLSSGFFLTDSFIDNLISLLKEKIPEKRYNKLKEYAHESFSSIFDEDMKRIYADIKTNRLRCKNSGYFGSHFVGLITANFLMFLEEEAEKGNLTSDNISSYIHDFINETRVTVTRDNSRLIGQFYNALEKNTVAFPREITMAGMELYATTYAAAFFYEKQDCVKADMFCCGDSRVYILDEDGLKLGVKDHSGKNGSMKELICLSKASDNTIKINHNHVELKKPCLVFACSDGTYGAFPQYLSPMGLEGWLLSLILKSQSVEEMQKGFIDTYAKNSTLDDCHSLAIAAFGMDTYDELKEFAGNRYQKMINDYELDQPPKFGIIMTDYGKKQYDYRKSSLSKMQDAFENLYDTNECVRQYCCGIIKNRLDHYSPEAVKEIKELERLEKESDEYADKIKNFFIMNYSACTKYWFKKVPDLFKKVPDPDEVERILSKYYSEMISIYERIDETAKSRPNLPNVKDNYAKFENLIKSVNEDNYSVFWKSNDVYGVFINHLLEVTKKMYNLSSDLNMIFEQGKDKLLDYRKENQKLYEKKNDKDRKEFLKRIDGYLKENTLMDELAKMEMLSVDRKNIEASYKEYQNIAKEQKEKINSINDLYDKAGKKWWKANYVSEMIKFMDSPPDKKPFVIESEEVLRELLKFIHDKDYMEIVELIKKQKSILTKYLETYCSLIDNAIVIQNLLEYGWL